MDYVDRLEAHFNAREPDVLAFVPEAGRFDRLRRDVRALLEQYPNAGARPSLFGVPVGVKDVFRVDGFPTRAGSRLPAELFEGDEAESVTRLKRAGALILGKTVSTEFAYFVPGPTRNPRNPAHTPGGSSSGSAAAVAAGLCPLTLGTQTIGSIIRPAAFCGAVGFKPSYERVSRAGVIPLSPSLDHVGPFAGNVAGVTQAARALTGDWRCEIPEAEPVLGVPDGPYLAQATEQGLAHFRLVCHRLTQAGYQLRSVPALADFEAIRERHNLIVAAEAARVHAEWFARHAALYHPRTADLIRRGQAVSDRALADALRGRAGVRDELTALMNAAGIDAWIAPSAPGSAPSGLESTGDPVMNLPWTHSGLPAINLPAGTDQAGLPMGLQVIGRWYEDEVLLAWAEAIERALQPDTILSDVVDGVSGRGV